MSHFNHRVWKRTYKRLHDTETFYSIRETYYNEAGEICACTEHPAEAQGETLEELKENLGRMLRAVENSFGDVILDYDNFKFADWDK